MKSLTYEDLHAGSFGFRLLELLPVPCKVREDAALMRCRMCHFSLLEKRRPDRPIYHALSYSWEGKPDGAIILINGHPFEPTPNLQNALRELRRQGIKWLWVDAICINQRNMAEKGTQLARMGNIYARARSVIAWIGPGDRHCDKAVNAMRDVSLSTQRISACSSSSHRDLMLSKIHGYAEIPKLFERSFWRRKWIIQEVSKAARVFVLCGQKTLRLEDILKPFVAGLCQRVVSPDVCTLLVNLGLFRYRERIRKKDISQMALSEALIRSRNFATTDPRDCIYALLQLTKDGGAVVPMPNYFNSSTEVFTQATRNMIALQGQTSLLFLARRNPKRATAILHAPQDRVVAKRIRYSAETMELADTQAPTSSYNESFDTVSTPTVPDQTEDQNVLPSWVPNWYHLGREPPPWILACICDAQKDSHTITSTLSLDACSIVSDLLDTRGCALERIVAVAGSERQSMPRRVPAPSPDNPFSEKQPHSRNLFSLHPNWSATDVLASLWDHLLVCAPPPQRPLQLPERASQKVHILTSLLCNPASFGEAGALLAECWPAVRLLTFCNRSVEAWMNDYLASGYESALDSGYSSPSRHARTTDDFVQSGHSLEASTLAGDELSGTLILPDDSIDQQLQFGLKRMGDTDRLSNTYAGTKRKRESDFETTVSSLQIAGSAKNVRKLLFGTSSMALYGRVAIAKLEASLKAMRKHKMRIVSTDYGNFRVVYDKARIDDEIYSLENCPMPAVLRRRKQGVSGYQDEALTFVGEVHLGPSENTHLPNSRRALHSLTLA